MLGGLSAGVATYAGMNLKSGAVSGGARKLCCVVGAGGRDEERGEGRACVSADGVIGALYDCAGSFGGGQRDGWDRAVDTA